MGSETSDRFETFDGTVRDDGWFEVSSDDDGEWIATNCPTEIRA